MSTNKQRSASRMPLQLAVTEHVGDQERLGLCLNLCPDGLYLNRLQRPEVVSAAPNPPSPVGLEFRLPDSPEVIWATGEIRHDRRDDCFQGSGICFTAIAEPHRRLISEHLGQLRRTSPTRW